MPQFTGGHIFIAWRHFRTPHGPLAPHSLNFKIFHRRLHVVKSNHPTSYMDICTSEYTTRATQEIWPHSSNTFFLPSSFPPFSYCLATRQRASITAKKGQIVRFTPCQGVKRVELPLRGMIQRMKSNPHHFKWFSRRQEMVRNMIFYFCSMSNMGLVFTLTTTPTTTEIKAAIKARGREVYGREAGRHLFHPSILCLQSVH